MSALSFWVPSGVEGTPKVCFLVHTRHWNHSDPSEERNAGIELEYAKCIQSLHMPRWDRKLKNLCTNIEKCKQILKNVNNKLKFSLVLTIGGLFAYMYTEFRIKRVKFLEYKSPMFGWPIFLSLDPSFTITEWPQVSFCLSVAVSQR